MGDLIPFGYLVIHNIHKVINIMEKEILIPYFLGFKDYCLWLDRGSREIADINEWINSVEKGKRGRKFHSGIIFLVVYFSEIVKAFEGLTEAELHGTEIDVVSRETGHDSQCTQVSIKFDCGLWKVIDVKRVRAKMNSVSLPMGGRERMVKNFFGVK